MHITVFLYNTPWEKVTGMYVLCQVWTLSVRFVRRCLINGVSSLCTIMHDNRVHGATSLLTFV